MKCIIDIETTGLSPAYSKIIVFGIKKVRGKVSDFVQYKEWEIGEKEVVRSILNELKKARVVVGYNIKKFDLPFIIERARALGLWKELEELENVISNIKIVDLFEHFGYGSLQRWAKEYNISLILPNINGSHMPGFYAKKDFEKILKHNADDIVACEGLLPLFLNKKMKKTF